MFHSARLTRRGFLKLGLLSAGVATSGIGLSRSVLADDLIPGGTSVSRTTGATRKAVCSNCAQCTARCGILGFVDEGRLVKIEGNPRDPNARGQLCAQGHAGINRLYDPDRVLFPLERAGRRGEGKWNRISWEEAYQKLEAQVKDAQATGADSLVLHTGVEASSIFSRRLVLAAGSRAHIDEVSLQNARRTTVNRAVLGADDEVVDVAQARVILNFGGNPYESHPVYLPFVQRLVDSRIAGARLITFDPRMSLTAGRSDEWLPLEPGTDGLVCMAMANVIVRQELHDRQFLSRWTDLSLDELPAQLAPYSPETTAATSGIRADDLRRIATEFARVRPSVALLGEDASRQTSPVDARRAVLLLNALVGSVGVTGGYSPAPSIEIPELDPVPAGTTFESSETTQFLHSLLEGKRTTSVYITALANPALSWPDSVAFRKTLGDETRVNYLVAIDTNLTETSSLADLVLPAATFLESWGLETPTAQEMVPFVALRQPVVRPRGESLSLDDILLTVGTRLKEPANQFFPFPTVESYLNGVVSRIPGLPDAGGFARLREQGVWYDAARRPEYLAQGEGFATPSGRIQLAPVPALLEGSEPWPLVKVSASTAESGAADLTLIPFRPNTHLGDYSANCWWLSEIAHTNLLLMNPSTAKQKGLKQGQWARVSSQAGAIQAKVRVTEGIHPRTVAIALGYGRQALGRVARAEKFKSDDPMTSLIWWHQAGNGVDASVLVGGNGLARIGTRVRVEALG